MNNKYEIKEKLEILICKVEDINNALNLIISLLAFIILEVYELHLGLIGIILIGGIWRFNVMRLRK